MGGNYTVVAQAATSVHTALGVINADMGDFVSSIARIGIGLGGVIATGLVAGGAITILTSTGEPEKLKNAREMITNALMGLALIVLALFVLQLLGWDILGIGRLTGVGFNSWS